MKGGRESCTVERLMTEGVDYKPGHWGIGRAGGRAATGHAGENHVDAT